MKDKPDQSTMISSIQTLISIIDRLHSTKGAGITEIAEHLDISKSGVHKHLKTLEENGFVYKTRSQYNLGLKFLKYGGQARDELRLYIHGRDRVEKIAQEINEMALLTIKDGDRGVFLFRANDQYNLSKSIPLGERFYLHQNGAGKAILSEFSNETIDMLIEATGLPQATPQTITTKKSLFEEIEQIRDRGYATNKGERDREVRAISASVTDEPTNKVGAISISFPAQSPKWNKVENYADVIIEESSKLSLRLKNM